MQLDPVAIKTGATDDRRGVKAATAGVDLPLCPVKLAARDFGLAQDRSAKPKNFNRIAMDGGPGVDLMLTRNQNCGAGLD